MSEKEIKPVEQDSSSSALPTSTRRNFFKKAAIGSAVITTVTSRPAVAGICNLSGNLSNNTSNHEHPDDCEYNLYSPGGLMNRSHGPKVWPMLAPLTPSSPLMGVNGLFQCADPAFEYNGTIASALGGNNNPPNGVSSGFIRQLTAAALNALIWEYAMNNCEDASCDILDDLDDSFYWTVDFATIEAAFCSNDNTFYNMYDWDAIQNID